MYLIREVDSWVDELVTVHYSHLRPVYQSPITNPDEVEFVSAEKLSVVEHTVEVQPERRLEC